MISRRGRGIGLLLNVLSGENRSAAPPLIEEPDMLRSYLTRKKKFVSSRIQGRLMFRFALYWTLYHVVLWHAIFVFRYVEYRLEAQSTGALVPFRELYGTFVLDYYPVVFCAFAALPIVLLDMLYLTHRVAGPLVRFQRALRELSEGKPVKPVKLRRGDLLLEFQDEFNRYLETLPQQETATADAMSEEEAQVVEDLVELKKSLRDRSEQTSDDPPEAASPSSDESAQRHDAMEPVTADAAER